jgi:hypothetical protein
MADHGVERAAREAVERVVATGTGRLPEPNLAPPPDDLPGPVRQAVAAYDAMPEWLVSSTFRHLCRLRSAVGDLYLLAHGFESTDGWAEVFDPEGTPLGAAQYVGGRVYWATVEEVRRSIQSGQRVPAAEAPAGWVDEPGGGCRSACGRFSIAPVGGAWRLTMGGTFIQDWATREDAVGHAHALALPAE